MPNYSGDLTDKDTLRLLATLRYVRKFITPDELDKVVVAEPEIGGVKIQITFGRFLDDVLNDYREFETELT